MLIGLVTKDAAIISSTRTLSTNGVTMKGDFDWIHQIGGNILVGLHGDPSDCAFFLNQLQSLNRNHEGNFSGKR
jgi:20S proteasome alpha/beta subunit